jgi:WD40 repeat protein
MRPYVLGHDIYAAVLSPDGSWIVTGSKYGTGLILDAATGKEIAVLRGHGSAVMSAAFSPDGSRILTTSEDKTARIWDTATGKEIIVLRGHESLLWSGDFSPDGTHIITASNDKTARIWDVHFATMPANGLVAETCLRRLPGFTRLTRDEMRLAGYPDSTPEIDVCAGVE